MKITEWVRALLLVLSLSMILSLIACGNEVNVVTDTGDQTEESEMSSDTDPSDADQSDTDASDTLQMTEKEESTESEENVSSETEMSSDEVPTEEAGATSGEETTKEEATTVKIEETFAEVTTADEVTTAVEDTTVETETECTHKDVIYTDYVANAEGNPDGATISGSCAGCNQLFCKPASFFASVESIFGDVSDASASVFKAGENKEPISINSMFSFGTEHPDYPENGLIPVRETFSIYGDMIGVSGWAAYLGSGFKDGAVFRIVDGEGEIIVDWTAVVGAFIPVTGPRFDINKDDVRASYPDGEAVGIGFTHLVNLFDYYSKIEGKTFDVVFAFKTSREGIGDIYIPYITLEDVHVDQKCQHMNREEIPYTLPTCTEDGNEPYSLCKDCGAMFVNGLRVIEVPSIPAAHTAVYVEAKASTCNEKGSVEHYTCTVCNKNLDGNGNEIADISVDYNPKNHGGSIAPNEICVQICDACGQKVSDELVHTPGEPDSDNGCAVACAKCGVSLGIQHGSIKYNYTEDTGYKGSCSVCKQVIVDSTPFMVYAPAESLNGASASGIIGVFDQKGGYTRFEGNGKVYEGSLFLPIDSISETGNYIIIKYRTNISDFAPETGESPYGGNIQIYHGTESANPGEGGSSSANLISDKEWHILVVDLHHDKHFKPNSDSEYVAKHIRLDIFNPNKGKGEDTPFITKGHYFDIGYIAMCDDLNAMISYLEKDGHEGDKDYCGHQIRVNNGECEQICAACGRVLVSMHSISATYTVSDNVRTYTTACANCDYSDTYTTTFGDNMPNLFFDATDVATAAKSASEVLGGTEIMVENGIGFVRIYNNPSLGNEAYFSLLRNNNGEEKVATGKYMLIKYRTTYGKPWEFFTGDQTNLGPKGGYNFQVTSGNSNNNRSPLITDGEWQIMLINVDGLMRDKFNPESDGQFYMSHLRWDIFNVASDKQQHIDVAYIAVADSVEKLIAIDGNTEAENCRHDVKSDIFTVYTDDLEITDVARKTAHCAICNARYAPENLRYIICVDSNQYIGSKKVGSIDGTWDAAANGFTAAEDGTVCWNGGWAGIDFGFDAVAYKVLDANGVMLSDGWQISGRVSSTEDAGIFNILEKSGVDASTGRRIHAVKADLTSYFETNNMVTVVYALVSSNIPEGSNDKYTTVLTVTNIAEYAAQEVVSET